MERSETKYPCINGSNRLLVFFDTGTDFSFVAMMFNIPIVGGSTGYAVGGT